MVYLYEINPAEHSPNNQKQLEYDLNEGRKNAFICIPNWHLDALKMNRGLYLSIPQPDFEELR